MFVLVGLLDFACFCLFVGLYMFEFSVRTGLLVGLFAV